jgi:uncharacterized protein (DUF2147 family)
MELELSMNRLCLPVATLGLMTIAIAATPARAAGPDGTWLSEAGDVKMKVAPCGGGICSHIEWLKDPNENGKPKVDKNNADESKRGRPIIGSSIMLNMKPDGADKWSGQVYNAEDGKTYSGSFTLAGANKADLKGCVAFICKSKGWTRSN